MSTTKFTASDIVTGCFATGINNTIDTSGKFTVGVIDTSGKFANSVVDTLTCKYIHKF